jgi:competence protein ComEA
MSVHISEDETVAERAISLYKNRILPVLHKMSYSFIANVIGIILCLLAVSLMVLDFSRQKWPQPLSQSCDLQIKEAASQLAAQIPEDDVQSDGITASVTGAVQKPGVYELDPGARYVDLIATASGYAKDVHRLWIDKNINLAARVQDGEQLYIPSVHDTLDDLCAQEKEKKDLSSDPQTDAEIDTANSGENKPLLNTATKEQLMEVPGVGEVRANTILQGQPYASKEDFQKRVSVPANVMEELEHIFQF